MSQQVQHGSAQDEMEPAAARPAALGTTTTDPVHCGRPMPVRPLDLTDPDGRANHAAAQAAVDGRRLHACACGFLVETEAPSGRGAPLVGRGDELLFHSFFTRRVLAAAGRVETAEWSFDQQVADASALLGCEDDAARRLWLFEADTESARWELDQAVHALHAELRLAACHGVPFTALAEAAGLDDETVTAAIHHDPVATGAGTTGGRAAAPAHRAAAEAELGTTLAVAG
ncbi:hypothetical protein [Kocuria sabuli]|uniref:hypothetical protein n=1 Tax=Kocuria sabuli TaxID=3071448 RepID=UPI0034D7B76E